MQSILIFTATQLVLLLAMISSTAVSVAFPNITSSFNTSIVLAGWVLSVYQLVSACSMVLMGKISDTLGRKNTFLICSFLFALGSLFAALAPNIQLLIAARFIQSIGGGGFIPTVIGIITEIFPQQRQQAIGIGISLGNIGGIIGPNVGGWLVTSFGWRSIFWFNVPIIVLAVIPLFFLLKSNKREKVQIDYIGAALLSAFLFSFMIGLSQSAQSVTGTDWTITGLLFIASVVFIMMFVRREMKTPDPIIDLVLLRLRPLAAANVYHFIYGACIFGFSSLIPLYAVSVYNMSTIQSGYILMTRSIGMIVASMASGFFLIKWGYRKPMILSSILISTGLFLFALEFSKVAVLGLEVSPVVLVSAIGLVMGLGMGIASTASANTGLSLMLHRTSTITGIRGMFRQGGGAISISVTTIVLQFVGNLSIGFSAVFTATGLIVLLTIPLIFVMQDKDRHPISEEAKTS